MDTRPVELLDAVKPAIAVTRSASGEEPAVRLPSDPSPQADRDHAAGQAGSASAV